ncbi:MULTISPECIES: DUF4190 domain-containing protein [unclassified Rathayibacter]|uniref:DUF4190 domain-containing protein n=1 Tax=unclassified Rathayibacter TaxID=2609250 RepID=UPI00188B748B|nr:MULTISPECIES: DUF4190 domain-containing protein [unclassified Rathayibacter]MBF4461639.1 DUF4190 domain-containing protein [Rathayibacter sp. VKM Ac-2879]MBF4503050.1 DUF4190 domain-containing protein [Rathayibacter sp. VKM Ac-2878]
MTDDAGAPQSPPAFAAPLGEPSAEPPPLAPVRPPLNPLAVAALVCGILGLAPAAIVLGHVSFAQAGRRAQRGRGLAAAGFLLGYLVLVLAVLGWFGYAAFVSGLRDDGYLPA